RGPEAFKRWRTLGAERSHPESVAQAACYSLGLYGECRDVVIATLVDSQGLCTSRRHRHCTS
ncbi:MAG: hypothetical protein OXG47_03730, partial [bacterium]|nr:hypothetical protein [bacterium]